SNAGCRKFQGCFNKRNADDQPDPHGRDNEHHCSCPTRGVGTTGSHEWVSFRSVCRYSATVTAPHSKYDRPTNIHPVLKVCVKSCSSPMMSGPRAKPVYMPTEFSPEAAPILSAETTRSRPAFITTWAPKTVMPWSAEPTHTSAGCCQFAEIRNAKTPNSAPALIMMSNCGGLAADCILRVQAMRDTTPITADIAVAAPPSTNENSSSWTANNGR